MKKNDKLIPSPNIENAIFGTNGYNKSLALSILNNKLDTSIDQMGAGLINYIEACAAAYAIATREPDTWLTDVTATVDVGRSMAYRMRDLGLNFGEYLPNMRNNPRHFGALSIAHLTKVASEFNPGYLDFNSERGLLVAGTPLTELAESDDFRKELNALREKVTTDYKHKYAEKAESVRTLQTQLMEARQQIKNLQEGTLTIDPLLTAQAVAEKTLNDFIDQINIELFTQDGQPRDDVPPGRWAEVQTMLVSVTKLPGDTLAAIGQHVN